MRLLIAGATGLVGNLVLEQALADTRVSRVIALTRRPLPPHAKLENVVIDFSAMPVQASWWSVDGVVCTLGTTRAVAKSDAVYRAIDLEYPLAVARQARKHGATRLALTSSLGANPRSLFFYTRTKGELESELRKLGFPSLTFVRPSVLDGHRARGGERTANIIFEILAPVLPRSLRVSPAKGIAALLLDGAIAAPSGVHIKTNADML